MKILFLHREFPGHFKYIAPIFAKLPNTTVMFITSDEYNNQYQDVNKFQYKKPQVTTNQYPFINTFEESVLHGQEAAKIAMMMKQNGLIPDIIFAHSWGNSMFMKDIFPNVPLLCYFEWFENADGAEVGFDGNPVDEGRRAQIRGVNVHRLIDLCACDAGISPTHWQKQQFPKEFHDKISVIHDGIDTDMCCPNPDAKFLIKDKNIEFTAKDEVITYATRGMEPMRGFPQFMEAVEKLQKKRPNAHFIIGGNDKVFYADKLSNQTYKEYMLSKLDLDMSRVHFVGGLNFLDYLSLLQVSSVHVYSTMPFVLSWSILEAMSAGCCIVASNTSPVAEVMKDKYNGLLFDFFNVNQLVEKIEYALDNKEEMKTIRKNARESAIEGYDFKKTIPLQIQLVNSLIKK